MKPRLNHRLTVDLSDAQDAERRRLVILTGTSTATLVRTALVVLAGIIEAKQDGKETIIAGTKVELPFTITPKKG